MRFVWKWRGTSGTGGQREESDIGALFAFVGRLEPTLVGAPCEFRVQPAACERIQVKFQANFLSDEVKQIQLKSK